MDVNKKVLVVDDDQNSRLIFQKYLTSMGFEAVMAHDGDEALELLARGPLIDLIITDVMMPYMSGFELTKKLKEYADTSAYRSSGRAPFTTGIGNEGRTNSLLVESYVLIAAIKKTMDK